MIFGTYKVKNSQVAEQIALAKSFGITRFDTAQLYKNETAVANACDQDDLITTKIMLADETTQEIQSLIKKSVRRFASNVSAPFPKGVGSAYRTIHTMLLHKSLTDVTLWSTFVDECETQKIPFVGVCNCDVDQLTELIQFCQQNDVRQPDVHQMEFHPFVPVKPVVDLCFRHDIQVQAHSILIQERSEYLNHETITAIASKYGVSNATLLVNWVRSFNDVVVCVNTSSQNHLQELASTIVVSQEDLDILDNLHKSVSMRLYHRTVLTAEYIATIVKRLQEDSVLEYPSDICEHLDLTGQGFRQIGSALTKAMWPDVHYSHGLSNYRKLLKSLRGRRIEYNLKQKLVKKGLLTGSSTCSIAAHRSRSGMLARWEKLYENDDSGRSTSYSDAIVNPKPMPVTVSSSDDFQYIYDFLLGNEVPVTKGVDDLIVFFKGAILKRNALDLCKQVVGPDSIVQLCDVVGRSSLVRHFLLGNNVAFQENEVEGASAMAQLMTSEKEIETWYLAGNCISHVGIDLMAHALQTNIHCTSLWLKRNPIGSVGATHLNRMLSINRHLVLLDLHNCGLFDAGVDNLLAAPELLCSLRHLYLDANGIENTLAIGKWAAVCKPTTLYLSINRLSEALTLDLIASLRNNDKLKRLCLASTRLTDTHLKELVDTLISCKRVQSLNIGYYKSETDLGEKRGNSFTDACYDDIVRLLRDTRLQFLNVAQSGLSKEISLKILEYGQSMRRKLSLEVGRGPVDRQHTRDELQLVRHPKYVVHIDSIYRGKM